MSKKNTQKPPTKPPEYLSINQVAELLGISRGSAWALIIARREVPHIRLTGRIVRVRRSDLDAYLERVTEGAV